MEKSRLTISRHDLYELVWQKPMWKLAPEFGLSGNGLAKLCGRNGIPVPDRGYWAKLQHGKKVRRPPLPPAKAGQLEAIVFVEKPPTRTLRETDIPEKIAQLLAVEREQSEPIHVPESPKPHSIVASWPKPQKPSYGNASWSPGAESRRRRIASVLFREIEKRGGVVSYVERKIKFTLLGASISVSFRERTKMVKIPPDPKRTYSYGYTEFQPTGLLQLKFEKYFDIPVRREWNETLEKTLETKLREIIVAWLLAIAVEVRHNESMEQDRRQREDAWLRHQELEREQRQERERIDDLLTKARDWEDADRVRRYVAAVVSKKNDNDEWARWALDVANGIDPTVD